MAGSEKGRGWLLLGHVLSPGPARQNQWSCRVRSGVTPYDVKHPYVDYITRPDVVLSLADITTK